ncbi:MAG: YczE/YyaS/YitT family protein [Peptostreptococcaceae bacterium]
MRSIRMLLGVLLIGIGIAFLRGSGFGTDPFTGMNIGVSNMIGTSLGVYQLCLNILLLIIVIYFDKSYIGLGMICNMVFVGFISDYFAQIIGNSYSLDIRILFTLIGVVITCLGVSLYSSANLGIAPYDAIGWIIESKSNYKLSFKTSRILTDLICIVAALLVNGPVSINTIIMAFCTGPLVTFFTRKIENTKLVSNI